MKSFIRAVSFWWWTLVVGSTIPSHACKTSFYEEMFQKQVQRVFQKLKAWSVAAIPAYFKFYLRKEIDAYLKEYEKQTGKSLNLFRDGLKIYVTLDSRMQKYAEEAIKQHLTVLQKNFNAEQARNPNRPYYSISKKTANDLMMAAVRRTGRYKQMKAEGMPEDSIIMDFKKPTKT
ncbi:hypothetical protein FQR65_LT16988 [Abscondita terminalis]|nr:hypothetical protein FQR65_LT16988 [Abscondita terminalis]